MKKLIVAVLVTFGFTAQALAWGDREQGALAGAAGVLLLQHIFKDRTAQAGYPPVYTGHPQTQPAPQPQVIYVPQPVIVAQPRRERVCRTVQIWDATGRFYYGDRQECRWEERW